MKKPLPFLVAFFLISPNPPLQLTNGQPQRGYILFVSLFRECLKMFVLVFYKV